MSESEKAGGPAGQDAGPAEMEQCGPGGPGTTHVPHVRGAATTTTDVVERLVARARASALADVMSHVHADAADADPGSAGRSSNAGGGSSPPGPVSEGPAAVRAKHGGPPHVRKKRPWPRPAPPVKSPPLTAVLAQLFDSAEST
jgi:hypothetical protein